jgi:hypothetical protein
MIPLSFYGGMVLTAVLVTTILAGRGRSAAAFRFQLLAWPIGVGLAFFVGALAYSGRPRWPLIRENEDRFLALLLPLVTLVEALALFSKSWLAWPGRVLVALAAAPILLLGSVYFQTWTTAQTCLWLGALASCLMLAWVSLDLQVRHLPPRTVLLGLAGVNAGAGITLMFAGYATGGPLGIILAVALATTVLVTPRSVPAEALMGVAGIGLVGLFALLVSGHFFASLGLDHAVILFAAPLLAWVLVLPRMRRTVFLRLAVLVLEAIPVLGIMGLAWKRSEEPEPPRQVIDDGGYSPSDYEQFKGPNSK